MAKLIGTAPNQTPTNADLGTMAYQDSNQIKVGTIDAKGKVQATDDVRLVAATSTTRRVNSFVADTAYNLGTSGGAAIAFHRTSDNSDEIGFETHQHGTSHLERFRIGSLGQFGVGGATYGTSGQVLTSGGASAAPTWAEVGGGAYNLLSTTTADNSSGSITIGSASLFSSTYTSYEIIVTDLVLANDTNVFYYHEHDGTLKGKTTSYPADYRYLGIGVNQGSRNAARASTSRADANYLFMLQNGTNETGGVANFRVNISRPSETNTYKIVTHHGAFIANLSVTGGIGNVQLIDSAGVWIGSDATTALTAITYETGAGNFVRGTFKLYGIS